MLPDSLPSLNRIDWLPVNLLSQIVVELAGLDSVPLATSTPSKPMTIFHAVNPSTTPWSTLIPAIASSLGPSVEVVPWGQWFKALQESQEKTDIKLNPGLKLLDFYEGADRMGKEGLEVPVLETVVTLSRSKSLGEVGAVSVEWMKEWMGQWGF